MKKILFALIAILAFSVTNIHAQTTAPATTDQSTTDKKATLKSNKQEIMNELNLTADQKKQLAPIQKDEKAQRAKINSDTSLSAEEKKAQLKSLNKESISKMSKILTPDQLQKLKDLKAKYKAGKDQADDTATQ